MNFRRRSTRPLSHLERCRVEATSKRRARIPHKPRSRGSNNEGPSNEGPSDGIPAKHEAVETRTEPRVVRVTALSYLVAGAFGGELRKGLSGRVMQPDILHAKTPRLVTQSFEIPEREVPLAHSDRNPSRQAGPFGARSGRSKGQQALPWGRSGAPSRNKQGSPRTLVHGEPRGTFAADTRGAGRGGRRPT